MKLRKGDVVQIDPDHDNRFGGCFLVVTEPKSWGAQGYVTTPEHAGLFYCRCPSSALKLIGRAEWLAARDWGDDPDSQGSGEGRG